jgi:hypothetical protein
VPLAEEQAFESDLPRKLAVPPLKGFADFAAELRDGGSVCNLFVRHQDHFPYWLSTVSSQLIGAGGQAPNREAPPTRFLDAKRGCLDAGDIGYSCGVTLYPVQRSLCALAHLVPRSTSL